MNIIRIPCNKPLARALSPRRGAKLVDHIIIHDHEGNEEVKVVCFRSGRDNNLPTGEYYFVSPDDLDRLAYQWLRERNLLEPHSLAAVIDRIEAMEGNTRCSKCGNYSMGGDPCLKCVRTQEVDR